MKSYQCKANDRRAAGAFHCAGKRYAQSAYNRASGEMTSSSGYGRAMRKLGRFRAIESKGAAEVL